MSGMEMVPLMEKSLLRDLGKPGITKTDEFSENCQTALDPPPLALVLEKILQIAILQNLIRFGDARQMEYYH